ncbi:hypothetical protein SDC9_206223 [bioreactor metagenome]|uniref:Uncharacterized protein n=1 Tax=bioreactor metagenome TaxID=1076179 RepID=A0A645J4E4_9ZZZZ
MARDAARHGTRSGTQLVVGRCAGAAAQGECGCHRGNGKQVTGLQHGGLLLWVQHAFNVGRSLEVAVTSRVVREQARTAANVDQRTPGVNASAAACGPRRTSPG